MARRSLRGQPRLRDAERHADAPGERLEPHPRQTIERANTERAAVGLPPIQDGVTNDSLRRTFASLLYEACLAYVRHVAAGAQQLVPRAGGLRAEDAAGPRYRCPRGRASSGWRMGTNEHQRPAD
jgi:hypothetical protein